MNVLGVAEGGGGREDGERVFVMLGMRQSKCLREIRNIHFDDLRRLGPLSTAHCIGIS